MNTTDRPTVTMLLVAYNQEKTIASAVRACLAQTYSPLEIIISDDCSSDGTQEVIKETVKGYSGPHQVIVNFNRNNLFICPHYNKILDMATGDIIVNAAGDDISVPHRVDRIVEEFSRNPNLMWLCSDVAGMKKNSDELTGKIHHLSVEKMREQILNGVFCGVGASAAFRRCLWSDFGCLNRTSAEDSIFELRGALSGDVTIIPEPLVYYRAEGFSNQCDYAEDLSPERQRNNFNAVAQKISDVYGFINRHPEELKRLEKLLVKLLDALETSLFPGVLRNAFPACPSGRMLLKSITSVAGRRYLKHLIVARLFPGYYKKKMQSHSNAMKHSLAKKW